MSVANLRVMRAMAQLNTSQTLFEQSSRAVEAAQRMHQIAESTYQQVLSDNSNIQDFIGLMNSTNETELIEILNVIFSVAIITESPTSLPLDVSYHVPVLNYTSAILVVVDLQGLSYQYSMPPCPLLMIYYFQTVALEGQPKLLVKQS